MKATSSCIVATIILGAHLANAQNPAPPKDTDPVLNVIRAIESGESTLTNEVTVVLDPPPAPQPLQHAEQKPEPENQAAPKPQPQPEASPDPAPEPESGLAVRVEKIRGNSGKINPSDVTLQAPFPAKPLSPTPPGWRLDPAEQAKPFTREVEISPGSFITLTIRPHLLVPEADGLHVIPISEPGFEPALGYNQKNTVGAVLADSIQNLDDDSRQLGDAIERLQQLLTSLPTPETPAAP